MRLYLSVLALFIAFSSSGQKVNKDFIDGEIYLKVKQKPIGAVSSSVNLSNELLFLNKFSADFNLAKSTKPFFTNSSENLQKIYRVSIKDPDRIDEMIKLLSKMPEVALVEKVRVRRIIATPNDPSAGSQWHLNKIKAFEAWDENPGNATVVVAVVDNAIQTNHPDLQANMLQGIDIADSDNNPNPSSDLFSHGTHVAGIVSAVSNNGTGVASASNNRIKILPVKATPNTGDPLGIYYGYEGIIWAVNNGADIISLSWGGIGYSQFEQEVIDYARDKGIIIVAAAGNENTSFESYPAAYRNVISVASLDSDDKKSSFSNYGGWVDIAAPGRGILSTYPFNAYESLNGTSMATPLISSALGFIWSCFPDLTPEQLEKLLKSTADNLDTDNPAYKGQLGAGRVNMLKAVSCANQSLAGALISTSGDPFICQGQTIVLTAPGNSGATYQWLKNGSSLNITTASYTAGSEGSYAVTINKGNCRITTDPLKVMLNTVYTSAPNVTGKEASYCTDLTQEGGLKATPVNCNYTGPTTFTYTGPAVGYDGFDKNGDDPTAMAFGLAGLITQVKVSITWQKKDQANKNACDLADAGALPYNDEISFKLKSPTGKIITLLAFNTYTVGTTSSGIVTTVFENGAAAIVTGSNPTSGTFAPKESFATFFNESPVGLWTLLPEDDNAIDPLCVKGFSVTITTSGPNQPSTLYWWSEPSGGSLLATGTEYIPPTTTLGDKNFFVQATCEGLCPSPRIPVRLTVVTVPQVLVFEVDAITTSNAKFRELIQKQTLKVTKNVMNTYELYDEKSPESGKVILGDNPPLASPVTMCNTGGSFLLVAQGCPTNVITWNTGVNGQSQVVSPGSPIGYNAYCHKEWSPCAPVSSNNVLFVSPSDAVNVTSKIYANTRQTFTGISIKATNEILTPSEVVYKANTSVVLNAGFSVSGNSVFTAKIGGCGD